MTNYISIRIDIVVTSSATASNHGCWPHAYEGIFMGGQPTTLRTRAHSADGTCFERASRLLQNAGSCIAVSNSAVFGAFLDDERSTRSDEPTQVAWRARPVAEISQSSCSGRRVRRLLTSPHSDTII